MTTVDNTKENYKLILENANDLIRLHNSKFEIEYVNEIAHKKVLGYTKEDLIGRFAGDFVHPDDFKQLNRYLEPIIRSGSGMREGRVKNKQGKWVWFEFTNKIILDKDGNRKFLSISRDITEKKITEQKLVESEEKFRTIAEQSSLGIIILQNGYINYANKAISEMTGYSPQDFKHWSQNEFLQKIYPEDQAIVFENLKRKLEGETETSSHYNCRIVTTSNKIKWIDLYSKLIKYKGANAILATFIDISDIKLAEKRLKESETNFRELYEEAPYAYLSISADGNILRCNKAASNLLGYSKEDLKNMKVFDLYADNSNGLPVSKKVFERFLDGEEIRNNELQMKKKDGECIWVSLSVKPIIDQSGNVIESRSMVIDITERKNAEQKLMASERLYREAYDRANFYKDLFTHDINNILQIINTSAELILYQLDDSKDNMDIKNIAEIIKKQVQRGAKLVKNVRTLSEIEESSMKLESFDICKVLMDSIDFLNKVNSERDVNIQVNCKDDNYIVYANDLLHDVFDNILINAIKYNDNLNVEITVNISREIKNDIKYIKLEFIDNAIGISELKKEILFKEGYRIEKDTKGMGLGLSLVYKIIQMYRGEIWVENRIVGDFTKGSKFCIMIPEFN
ncbi:MAG: PAS domain S-box protein [Promethearchaeota archaeon]